MKLTSRVIGHTWMVATVGLMSVATFTDTTATVFVAVITAYLGSAALTRGDFECDECGTSFDDQPETMEDGTAVKPAWLYTDDGELRKR